LKNKGFSLIDLIDKYGGTAVAAMCLFLVFAVLLPILIVSDLLLFGHVEPLVVFQGLLHGVLFIPVLVYLFMRIYNELSRTRAKLTALSITDDLTGVNNRRYFDSRFSDAVAVRDRKKTAFALLVIDVDHFKKVNDSYGHQAGDSVIRQVAMLCKSLLRDGDTFSRYGGEEFVCIMQQDVTRQEAEGLAKRINRSISNVKISYENKVIPITVSVGVAYVDRDSKANKQQIFKTADDALYLAKQVCVV